MRNIIYILLIALLCSCGSSSGRKRVSAEERTHTLPATFSAEESEHITVNVYIENSGSMYGYVGDNKTDFKTSVGNYLSDIKISGITDSLNLYYINSTIIPCKSDIPDFIGNINKTAGNKGSTDIANLISTILNETRESTISILISDFIFSPGRGMNADQYLINQQIRIKTDMAEALKAKDLGIIIYQLSSEFKGTYYNLINQPTKINARRPFYIWVIGSQSDVAKLHSEIPTSKFKGSGVENMFSMIRANHSVDYAIRPGTGRFSFDKSSPKTKIVKARKSPNGQLTFAVDVDFSELLLDEDYLKDETHYIISDKDYQMKITDSPVNAHNYTQSLNLRCDKIKPSNLSIKLTMVVPDWVEQINDDEGINIHANGAISRTYGIKYLINGVYEAFKQKEDDCYTEIKISINH